MTITPRIFVAAVGVAMALAGLVFLTLPITAVSDSGLFGASEISCGSALADNTSALGGDPLAQCRDAVGGRRMWAWPLGLVGVVAILGAAFVASPTQRVDTEQ